jgi:vanillate O-demethylase monooxygenase subunit
MIEHEGFMKRAWYVAAMSQEVDESQLFHRKIMGLSVLIYRDAEGSAVAMQDRCPHRFAPLSLGSRVGDDITCPYHGLRFNSAGACVHNPHGRGQLPKGNVVRTFALLERHGFIWIWMSEEEADPDLLPDFSVMDHGHVNGIGHTYMHMKVDYRLILDNVMDLSHVDYVHGEMITTRGNLSPLIPDVMENEKEVSSRWEWTQTPPMMIFNDFLPRPSEPAEHFIQVNWNAPATILLAVGAAQNGVPFEEGISQLDMHCCTPEGPNTTHYFFATRRNHNEEDAEFSAIKLAAMHSAFEDEDGPLIAAVEAEMGGEDFFSLKPMLLSNDLAAVKLRRQLSKLVAAEG